MSNSTITKEKLAKHLQNNLGLCLAICDDFVNEMFQEITNLILRDKKIMMHKFGTWKVSTKKERPGFDIHAGKSVKIPTRNVLQFKSCKLLRDQLNER